MIPKEIITRAIEGGWAHGFVSAEEILAIGSWQHVALDPLFWQALGRGLGWNANAQTYVGRGMQTNWYYEALRFYDLILTGQPTDTFWEKLLTKETK